jgi:hypothetical protein
MPLHESTHKICKELQGVCARSLCFVVVCKWLFSFLNMTISRSLCSSFLVLYSLDRVHKDIVRSYDHISDDMITTTLEGHKEK